MNTISNIISNSTAKIAAVKSAASAIATKAVTLTVVGTVVSTGAIATYNEKAIQEEQVVEPVVVTEENTPMTTSVQKIVEEAPVVEVVQEIPKAEITETKKEVIAAPTVEQPAEPVETLYEEPAPQESFEHIPVVQEYAAPAVQEPVAQAAPPVVFAAPPQETVEEPVAQQQWGHITDIYADDYSLIRREYYDENNQLQQYSDVTGYNAETGAYVEDVYHTDENGVEHHLGQNIVEGNPPAEPVVESIE